MKHQVMLNILLAIVLGTGLLLLEAMGYKLTYNLTLIAKDEFIYFILAIQIYVIYITLYKLEFNK